VLLSVQGGIADKEDSSCFVGDVCCQVSIIGSWVFGELLPEFRCALGKKLLDVGMEACWIGVVTWWVVLVGNGVL